MLDSQRADVLRWLHPGTTALTNDEVINNHHEDTCLWILDDEQYKQWLQGPGDILVCTGDRKSDPGPALRIPELSRAF